jgi:hypothetical protein
MAKDKKPRSELVGWGTARSAGEKVEERDKKTHSKALEAEAAMNAALGIKKKKKK